MLQTSCKICQKIFYVKPSWIKKGWGKYCSRKCQFIGQKTGQILRCFLCANKIYRMKGEIDGSKSKKYFCTKSCQTRWRNSIFSGEKHKNWKGGESTYRNILTRNKVPMECKRCKISDDRILAVHHIDKNRKNNTLHNLIWLCHNCHYLIHHDNVEWEKIMGILV